MPKNKIPHVAKQQGGKRKRTARSLNATIPVGSTNVRVNQRKNNSPDTNVYLNLPGKGEGSGHPVLIISDTSDDESAKHEAVAEFQQAATRWSYVLSSRMRWADSEKVRHKQSYETQALLSKHGIGPEILKEIVDAGLVEVDIPFGNEKAGWALRSFPWEAVLAIATRDMRSGKDLTVVRHLRRLKSSELREESNNPPTRRSPAPLLYIESVPEQLRQRYSFETERELVRAHFNAAKGHVQSLRNPIRSEIEQRVKAVTPSVVHLAGFDVYQGFELLDIDKEPSSDGYLVRHSCQPGEDTEALGIYQKDDNFYENFEAQALAMALNSGTVKPRLVSCNLSNSSAEIAARCVQEGAEAAIGFQDSFDDRLSELLFATFYRAWGASKWNTTEAFRYAWNVVRGSGLPLQGTGVVLWSARSIQRKLTEGKGLSARQKSTVSVGEIENRLRQQVKRQAKRTKLTPENVRQYVGVDVKPVQGLNYSILHNNGPLFTTFTIFKKDTSLGRIDDIAITVELHVGTETYPFRTHLALDEKEPSKDILSEVKISLASSLGRGVRESVHTSLFVEVFWRGTVLYKTTHRVTLLPIDEWRDDDANRMWLPSFALPRDPAVLSTIDAAQRYLMALEDDSGAGFDGYQRAQPELQGDPVNFFDPVDLQVRAIWSALLYETPLSYINPPPTFTDRSQRLRGPSDVLQGKRGTCIDLALLLASCLEYIEIYPVIFLLETHAFPGYWRHDTFHENFKQAKGVEASLAGQAPGPRTSAPQLHGWYFQKAHYREIVNEVQAGRLVPLETVLLTQRARFADAVDEGHRNLTSKREFDAMIDIQLARTDGRNPVTPLPIKRGES